MTTSTTPTWHTITEMDDVQEVALVSAPDPQWGESVVAVIVPRGHADPNLADIQAHCRSQLSGCEVPRRLVTVERLRRGATSKIQKAVFTDQFWGAAARKVGG
jgi:fatty-acyl-CoA synthase